MRCGFAGTRAQRGDIADGGYLIAPEGAIAVNIPVWNINDENNTVHILNYDHVNGIFTVAPTCTEDGYTKDGCKLCDEGTISNVVKASGHTVVIQPGIAATCTVDGLTEGSYCSACSQVLAEQKIIPAGHTIEITKAVLPSAEHTGLTAGLSCGTCGQVKVAQKVIPAVKTLDDYLAGKRVSVLGDSISTYLGVSNDISRNTNTAGNVAGYRDGGYYNNDDVTSVDLTWWQQSINAFDMKLLVNHASGSGTLLTKVSNGTLPAYYDEKCLNLHDNSGDNAGITPDIITVYIGVNDSSRKHSAGSLADIDFATLIQGDSDSGYTYAVPSTMAEGFAIMLHKMQQHYPDAEIYLFTIPRTNDPAPAYADTIREVAGYYGARVVDLYGSALTESGYSKYFFDGTHPNAAGMKIIADLFQDALLEQAMEYHLADGHEYTATVTAPTCTGQGYTTHICSICGDSYLDAYVEASGHSYGVWEITKAATATVEGEEQRQCVCGEVQTRKLIPVQLTASVEPVKITAGTKPEDVKIGISAALAIDGTGVTDLELEYTITDESGKEFTLEEALKTPGKYTITPKVKTP